MTTPEGKIKDRIDRELGKHAPALFYHKPVQNGMGKPILDYVCCFYSYYFAIEAKAEDKDLTQRQQDTRDQILIAGGTVFRVRDDAELDLLRNWLNGIVNGDSAVVLGVYIHA